MNTLDVQSDIVIKAISNETRRQIVRLLASSNHTYSELAQLLHFDPRKESGKFNFHLKELVNAALVQKTETNGNESYSYQQR